MARIFAGHRAPVGPALVAAVMSLLLVSCPNWGVWAEHRPEAEPQLEPAEPVAKLDDAPAKESSNQVQPANLELNEHPGEWEAEEQAGARSAYNRSDFGVDPDRALTSIRKETFVFSKPNWRSRKLGYLRAGAVVPRSAEPVMADKSCKQGWYEVEPEGYVCVGKTASLDVDHRVASAARQRPYRHESLPYMYGISKYPTPPFYVKLPSKKEQRKVEKGLAKHLRLNEDPWASAPVDPVPEFLQGKTAPTLHGYEHSSKSVYTGRGLPQSGFAFVRLFEHEGRRFGLSTDMAVMPLDRMKPVEASEFKGMELNDAVTLPVVFVMTQVAMLFEGDPRSTGLKPKHLLQRRTAVPVSGKRVKVGGVQYLQTKSGNWLRNEGLVYVGKMKKQPGWAKPGRTWVDISILKQRLVAYVGTKPVYVTLVSTGADGLGDPEKTHSTVRGQFLIHTKHVSVTMSGDEVGDEFDLRDVPYVQYFTEGYALHASYWHDSFGKPRSHGCINLSPEDARWLFNWTDPQVPERWHGAMSLREGTLVYVHP